MCNNSDETSVTIAVIILLTIKNDKNNNKNINYNNYGNKDIIDGLEGILDRFGKDLENLTRLENGKNVQLGKLRI